MEFEQVIRTRRSVRSYSEKEIPGKVLEKILEGARIAPSGNNKQPWSFVVVTKAEKKSALAEYCYGQAFVANATVVIVCCAKKYPNPYEPFGDNCYLVDAVIAIDHMILAARDQGVGTCWVGALHQEPIKKLLNIPDDVDVLMVVPMGYPAGDSFREVSYRKKLQDIAFSEEFGKPFS